MSIILNNDYSALAITGIISGAVEAGVGAINTKLFTNMKNVSTSAVYCFSKEAVRWSTTLLTASTVVYLFDNHLKDRLIEKELQMDANSPPIIANMYANGGAELVGVMIGAQLGWFAGVMVGKYVANKNKAEDAEPLTWRNIAKLEVARYVESMLFGV